MFLFFFTKTIIFALNQQEDVRPVVRTCYKVHDACFGCGVVLKRIKAIIHKNNRKKFINSSLRYY